MLDPQPDDILIEDICHSLSRQCRYVGNCSEYYSVAEHTVRGSFVIDESLAGEFFGHDFSEMLLGDMSFPLREMIEELSGEIREWFCHVEKVFAEAFGLKYPFIREIKDTDMIMGATERRDLTKYDLYLRKNKMSPLNDKIMPWGIEAAEYKFMNRYYSLYAEGLIL